MSPETVIQKALEKVETEWIRVAAGPCFDWVGRADGKPYAVNWAGAVLWAHRRPLVELSTRYLFTVLDIDAFWFYRFTIGFDQGRVLSVLDHTMKEVGKDEVSAAGVRIAKEAGIKRK